MIFEIVLVLAVCIPLIAPLACFTFAGHYAVFKWSSLPLKGQLMPSTHYLWFSLMLGVMLQVWLFYEAELHGTWLVVIGSP